MSEKADSPKQNGSIKRKSGKSNNEDGSKIANKKQKIDNSKTDNSNENEPELINDKVKKMEAQLETVNQHIKIISNRVERCEIENKKKTVRVFGIPNQESDPQACLLEFLKCINQPNYDIKLITDVRFLPGTAQAKSKCLKLDFNSMAAKSVVMGGCKYLQNNKFKGVTALYVDNDLTPKQIKMKVINRKVKDALEHAVINNPDVYNSECKLKLIGFNQIVEHVEKSEDRKKPVQYSKWIKQLQLVKNKDDKLKNMLKEIKLLEKQLNEMV